MVNRGVVVVWVCLFGFLLFCYGALSVSLQIFPYKFFSHYLLTVNTVVDALDKYDYNIAIRWPKAAPENTGVVFKAEKGLGRGLTLYTSTHDTSARLIDADGRLVHEWSFKFSEVWDNQDHIISLGELDDFYFFLRDFHLYDNGDLLLMVSAGGVTPWGMGLVKLDKDSNVLWKYSGYPNNDFEVGPDGTIYVIEHEIRQEALALGMYQTLPFLEDNITLFSPDGQEIKSISLIDAVEQSRFKDLLKQLSFYDHDGGDPSHSNAISYIEADHPSIPWMKRGNLLISIRNINAFAVLDPVSGQVVHADGLKSRMQHDIDYLPNGRLLVFDNRGSFTEGGYSRVIEFDPVSHDIYWSYDPEGEDVEFESMFWGAQQRLPNGNTLIVHADAGRVIEVDADKDLLWEYYIPLTRDVDGVDHIGVVTSAERIDAARIQFQTQVKER